MSPQRPRNVGCAWGEGMGVLAVEGTLQFQQDLYILVESANSLLTDADTGWELRRGN